MNFEELCNKYAFELHEWGERLKNRHPLISIHGNFWNSFWSDFNHNFQAPENFYPFQTQTLLGDIIEYCQFLDNDREYSYMLSINGLINKR